MALKEDGFLHEGSKTVLIRVLFHWSRSHKQPLFLFSASKAQAKPFIFTERLIQVGGAGATLETSTLDTLRVRWQNQEEPQTEMRTCEIETQTVTPETPCAVSSLL